MNFDYSPTFIGFQSEIKIALLIFLRSPSRSLSNNDFALDSAMRLLFKNIIYIPYANEGVMTTRMSWASA